MHLNEQVKSKAQQKPLFTFSPRSLSLAHFPSLTFPRSLSLAHFPLAHFPLAHFSLAHFPLTHIV